MKSDDLLIIACWVLTAFFLWWGRLDMQAYLRFFFFFLWIDVSVDLRWSNSCFAYFLQKQLILCESTLCSLAVNIVVNVAWPGFYAPGYWLSNLFDFNVLLFPHTYVLYYGVIVRT